MYLFWDIAVHPILKSLQPKTILEIGSDRGHTTEKLLAYCQQNGASLHVIDPLPKYDTEAWQERYGAAVTFHRDLSLNALPLAPHGDLVLIDGDHNWYTVFHELKSIEQRCVAAQRPFPVVLLHDIDWPYGRRDLYYNPENIPLEYRQAHKQQGLRLDSPSLAPSGGFNPHLQHSIYENALRNGVRTAVEDFIAESQLQLGFYCLAGFHGLGILATDRCREENPELAKFLESLEAAAAVEGLMRALEQKRLEGEIKRLQQKQEATKLEQKIAASRQQIVDLQQASGLANEAHARETAKLGTQIENLERRNRDYEREIAESSAQIESLQRHNSSEASKHQEEIGKLNAQIESLQRRNLSEASKHQEEISKLNAQIENLQRRNLSEASKHQEEIGKLSARYSRFAQDSERDIRWLVGWIEELGQSITSILNTNRWKVGNLLYTAYRKARSQSLDEPPEKQLARLMEGMRAWQKQYEDRRDRERAGGTLNKEVTKTEKSKPKARPLEPEISSSLPAIEATDNRVSTSKVDIVVCVHNALDDVRLCLESIERETSLPYHLYIVNDGSEEETSSYLRDFANSRRKHCTLLESKTAGGYTVAANRGLRASTADCVVLLNSDTIATSRWLELLLECLRSDPKVGIVSPLSNAATWQSVPEIKAPEGGWAINSLPSGISPNAMAALVCSTSRKQFPQVPFLNGFCLCLKRELINAIGYLDEEAFPRGYGEENDYCLRAADAGYTLAIADSAYVFHAKSKSYGQKQRSELAKTGNQALQRKHGQEKIASQLQRMKDNSLLGEIRDRIRQKLAAEKLGSVSLPGHERNTSPRILFLLPVRGGGGGAHSVVQEAMGMQKLNVEARIATQGKYKEIYKSNYPSLNSDRDLFCFYSSQEDLVDKASGYDIVVATIFTSVRLLQAILEKNPQILPAYYVQDYEPWFCRSEPSQWEQAHNSYAAIPGNVLFAKTAWLCDLVRKEHAVEVAKVSPSLDRDLYYPSKTPLRADNVVRIAAMIRPATPRRGPARTMRVLSRISEQFGERVEISIFGCEDRELECHAFERQFPHRNCGILKREDVAELLRQTDIFVDYSDYQAFGRTGLEAMACGCVTVLPLKGGTSEYARHEENALLADTNSEEDCYGQLARLVTDSSLRASLRERGLAASSQYSIEKAAMSELEVLQAAFQQWQKA